MGTFQQFLRSRAGLSFLALLMALSVGILIGTIVSDPAESAGQPEAAQLTLKGSGNPLVLDRQISLHEGFSKVVETVGPAVVNIRTEGVVEQRGSMRGRPPDAFREFFGDDFWDRFFDQQPGPRERKITNLGSGVIVDSQGYILTNHHVVNDADRILVKIADGDTHPAKLIGSDPESDLAVLKVESDKPLPFAKVGDSSTMKVGDWVLAIGSPFGLERTVTSGIISAIERVVPTGIFGDYIQTDAAINPGNSGGPLVNMRGEIVGINSFISTRSGGSNGVGFAIPSTVFVDSYNQLISTGRIERGWLGVAMNTYPMTQEMAEYFGVDGDDPSGIRDGDGVIVTQVIDESGKPGESGPAYKSGIRPEDVIVKFGNREIETVQDLRLAVAKTPPGKEVNVVVIREKQVKNFTVTLDERTLEAQTRERDEGITLDERQERDRTKEIGVEVRTFSRRDAERLGLEDEEGVIILDITPGSLADDAGLAPNQVITHVNGQTVTSGAGFRDRILSMSSGEGVVLRVVTVDANRTKAVLFTSFIKP